MGQGQPGWRSTNFPPREKIVRKAEPGQGWEWLKGPEAGALLLLSEEHVAVQSIYGCGPPCLSSRQGRTFLHSWEKMFLFRALL